MSGEPGDGHDGDGAAGDGETEPVSTPMPFRRGDVVAGKYRVEAKIGAGGMGVVVSATHLLLEERVALKFVLASAEGAVATERLLREARVTAKLRSENVVRVLDVGIADRGIAFIAMELLHGEDLRARLADGGRLPPETAIEYGLGACDALAEAHAIGVVHRDVKPSNLYLARSADGREVIKLLDFGVSKLCAPGTLALSELTGSDVVIGSPRYMSPEQLSASTGVDRRADVWSLAAVLFECLAGHPPFRAHTLTEYCMVLGASKRAPRLRAIREDVPEALDEAIARALAFNRDERTSSIEELARDLSAVLPATHPLRQRWTSAAIPRVAPHSAKSARAADPASETATRSAMSTSVGAAGTESRGRRRLAAITLATIGTIAAAGGVAIVSRGIHATPTAASPPAGAAIARDATRTSPTDDASARTARSSETALPGDAPITDAAPVALRATASAATSQRRPIPVTRPKPSVEPPPPKTDPYEDRR